NILSLKPSLSNSNASMSSIHSKTHQRKIPRHSTNSMISSPNERVIAHSWNQFAQICPVVKSSHSSTGLVHNTIRRSSSTNGNKSTILTNLRSQLHRDLQR